MSLANCKHCGGLFLKQRSVYCDKCQKVQNDYYFKLREYLKVNPKSSVMDAHHQTGIPISKLIELQKEEYVPFER